MIGTKIYPQNQQPSQTKKDPPETENISDLVKNISILTQNIATPEIKQVIANQIIEKANCNEDKTAVKPESKSTLVSKNVIIESRRTSVRLEPEMWSGLGEISQREGLTVHKICTDVSQQKLKDTSLTAAIRVFIMSYFRAAATEEGHRNAHHGNGVLSNGGGTMYCSRQTSRFSPTSFS
ncbi:MAG: ribbon-helix-helix domain-containing protein [Alphaproteobacteria bacterium]|nr:ribbon-helix-helix domain-containing protein [Alphaproteobacteria bacterium]MCL2504941.1 ribbon-helix-helix domain-containing protein [Alphaproteobacteria bacterium]